MSKRSKDEEKRENYIEHRRTPPPVHRRGTQRDRLERKQISENKSTASTQIPDDFSAKREAMKSELNSLLFRVNNLPSIVNQIDGNIKGISNRITSIKAGGYYLPGNFEEQLTQLNSQWSQLFPELSTYSTQQSNLLLQKQSILESSIQNSSSLNELSQYDVNMNNIAQSLNLIESTINSKLQDYQSQYDQLNKELRRAEETSANLSNTSIKWKEKEYPLYATKVKDLTNNTEGILTLSNLRILFEEEKEEVIKKTLFFATEKRTIRETLLDEPIGSIDSIEKAKVGFFRGAGIYIKFKPQTNLEELKIDTRSDDDQDIIRFYDDIISGNLESDKKTDRTSTGNIPTTCPNCSAPFTDDILKGQTSIKCKYCGSVIKL